MNIEILLGLNMLISSYTLYNVKKKKEEYNEISIIQDNLSFSPLPTPPYYKFDITRDFKDQNLLT
jgi:hypothetical protein